MDSEKRPPRAPYVFFFFVYSASRMSTIFRQFLSVFACYTHNIGLSAESFHRRVQTRLSSNENPISVLVHKKKLKRERALRSRKTHRLCYAPYTHVILRSADEKHTYIVLCLQYLFCPLPPE